MYQSLMRCSNNKSTRNTKVPDPCYQGHINRSLPGRRSLPSTPQESLGPGLYEGKEAQLVEEPVLSLGVGPRTVYIDDGQLLFLPVSFPENSPNLVGKGKLMQW